MKYFVIAGEASGDLHAANLVKAIRAHEPDSVFYAYGGDMMAAAGAIMLQHYKDIAYMGFFNVMTHAGVILRAMRRCKRQISELHPDVLLLVDYPGFNLAMAKYAKTHTDIPVFYYISPKIWAWNESRIKLLRAYVDEIFSILPFEVDYFKNRGINVHYVGNPTVDEVESFSLGHLSMTAESFAAQNGMDTSKKIIALLAGSRKQEIGYNLRRMCLAARPMLSKGFTLVVAGAPNIDSETYMSNVPEDMQLDGTVKIVSGKTYELLNVATSALVTSGTATLETALFKVPQAVCYYIPAGRIVSAARKRFLKVKYISLVNLVAEREVVKEFVAGDMNVANVRSELERITLDEDYRARMLLGYDEVSRRLGNAGAPARAAIEILRCMEKRFTDK